MEIKITEIGKGYAHIQVGEQDLYVEWSDGKGIDYIDVNNEEWEVSDEYADGSTSWSLKEDEEREADDWGDRCDYEYERWRDKQLEESLGW